MTKITVLNTLKQSRINIIILFASMVIRSLPTTALVKDVTSA